MTCVDVRVRADPSRGVKGLVSRQTETWKVDVIRQLKHRDKSQHDVFHDLVRHSLRCRGRERRVTAASRSPLLIAATLVNESISTGPLRNVSAASQERRAAAATLSLRSVILQEHSRMLDKSSISADFLRTARVPAGPDVSSENDLKTMTGELACQVVALQQEVIIKEKVLEQQHRKLSAVQQSFSRTRGDQQDLQGRVSQVQEANAGLKREYDALLECHRAAEQRFRQEKQRGCELLEDMIHHKQQAAARMNSHNERRSRARQVKLQKDLQVAQETPVTMTTTPQPVFSATSPPKDFPERTHSRLFRSASATSPRILTSIKELFERKRRGNSVCSVDQEVFRPARICVSAQLPVRARHSLDAHEQSINAVRFSSSSDLLATGGTDRVIKLWDLQAGTRYHGDTVVIMGSGKLNHRGTLDGSTGGITSIEFDPAGLKVLAASYNNSALLWSIDDSVPKVTLTGHSRKVTAARFRFCPQQVVTGSADRTLKLWDLQRAACVSTVQVFSYCSDLVCSENAVISGHFDGQIRLWDTRTASCTLELPAQGKVTSLDLCSDLRQLLSCCRDDCLQLLDLRGSNRRSLRAEGFKCGSDSTKAVFSPDGGYATAGSADGSLYIWSVTNGKLQTCLSGEHSSSITAVSWSLSGNYVVSVDKSRRAVLWSDI
ncbi:Autophagy-related protein 16-2 [Merluccius polli]|uniref:Autophagy-related protein 16-2 n=1 Tax=Merluccius polli TaxID=89951 RepID=A0AA47P7G2_MERPO|nr:Autophagy-related protein 16-2 [Merluccius polli]